MNVVRTVRTVQNPHFKNSDQSGVCEDGRRQILRLQETGIKSDLVLFVVKDCA